jgi:hypothetical protein
MNVIIFQKTKLFITTAVRTSVLRGYKVNHDIISYGEQKHSSNILDLSTRWSDWSASRPTG